MKTILKSAAFLLCAFTIPACSADNKVVLFNGENLDNWEIYVGTPDVEPGDVFWVEDGLIQTSGIPNGYIQTRESYRNYKLHVEWRWSGEPTNSGVLLHKQGEDMIWPQAIECQLMHEHAGDIVLIGEGSGITVKDSTYLITPGEGRFKNIGRSEEMSENPPGEWNSYDITSREATIEVVVNGVLQNSGTGMTLSEGRILLQSEGSPVQFRNIYLEPL
jgi:hypothetical protein